MLVTPTLEWQDRLTAAYARINTPPEDPAPSRRTSTDGQRLPQRRRLDRDVSQPDWDRMYKMDKVHSGT